MKARNPIAASLRSPHLRPQKIPSKKAYTRKPRTGKVGASDVFEPLLPGASMTELVSALTFTHDATIPEGAAALVILADGSMQIAHNIAAVRETGTFNASNLAPILMAVTALETVNDETAFGAAMDRAAAKIGQLALPSSQDSVN